jgi:hypothetical protein
MAQRVDDLRFHSSLLALRIRDAAKAKNEPNTTNEFRKMSPRK